MDIEDILAIVAEELTSATRYFLRRGRPDLAGPLQRAAYAAWAAARGEAASSTVIGELRAVQRSFRLRVGLPPGLRERLAEMIVQVDSACRDQAGVETAVEGSRVPDAGFVPSAHRPDSMIVRPASLAEIKAAATRSERVQVVAGDLVSIVGRHRYDAATREALLSALHVAGLDTTTRFLPKNPKATIDIVCADRQCS